MTASLFPPPTMPGPPSFHSTCFAPRPVDSRLAEVLGGLLTDLAAGRAVQVIPFEEETGTQQAAELLNVSRPSLVKLIESGTLPHRNVGPRRRLHLENVLTYRAGLDALRQAALQALADDLQDLGLDRRRSPFCMTPVCCTFP